ncbi:MAG TPA: hypothetical protein VMG81_06355 [Thermoplasmata archaeon]|nr:hypothetical protein [Thermoplasmata archaeon]
MRTKPVEGVLRLDVVALDPRPAIYLAYDGLAGISQRPLLRDLVEELERKGPGELAKFLEALRAHRSGQVHVYFSDYVSYGIGGGDAAAEFFLGTFLVLHEPARAAGKEPAVPEHLALYRPGGVERLALEGASA